MNRPEPMARAKRPRSVVAGPYGHPFHPILIVVPLGAWISSLVFDIASLVREDGAVFAQGAHWLIGIGLVGSVLAAALGLMDASRIDRSTKASSVAITHGALNTVAMFLFLGGFVLRTTRDYEQVAVLELVVSVAGLAVLGVSGWLGGKLSYSYGVRVADEADQAGAYSSERSTRSGPPPIR